MCKEDVRIKRKTARRTFYVAVAGGTRVPVLPANPERCALIVCLNKTVAPTTNNMGLRLGPVINGRVQAIASLNDANTNVVLTIEQVGQILTEQMFFTCALAAYELFVTEIYWEVNFEDIEP